ncbi:MAG: DUF4124 domain-containing protein [Thermodesulfovibrionales bacterium]
MRRPIVHPFLHPIFRECGLPRGFLLLLALAILLVPSPSASEVYKYVNKDGVVSYTDSLQAVPDKYRKKATVVKGLREQDEKSVDKAPANEISVMPEQETRQVPPQQDSIPVKQQIETKVQNIREKGYWKPVAVILALIAIFALMGKASESLGHKRLWTVLRLIVVLGLMSYFLYAYADGMSGVYSSLSKQVYSIKGRIDKRHVDENKLQNEVFQDNKKQGEKR